MDDHTKFGLLYDFYGALLTPKQAALMELYFGQDLSLGEIAEEEGITRQAVRDHLLRAERQLMAFEEALGLMQRAVETEEIVHEIEKKLAGLAPEAKREIQPLLNRLIGEG